jgi:LacI family transcriptional regulator
MAVGAIRTLHAKGLSVPDDMAIVGFDDIQVAGLLAPALTTVRQDMVGIGLSAGRALVEQIENPDATPPVLTLPVELVVRASCGARPGAAADGQGGGADV